MEGHSKVNPDQKPQTPEHRKKWENEQARNILYGQYGTQLDDSEGQKSDLALENDSDQRHWKYNNNRLPNQQSTVAKR